MLYLLGLCQLTTSTSTSTYVHVNKIPGIGETPECDCLLQTEVSVVNFVYISFKIPGFLINTLDCVL